MGGYTPKKIRLSERDLKVIELVGKLGILSLDIVSKLYGDTSSYHLNRMKVLCAQKYLVRKNNHLTLGAAGKKLLESEHKEIKQISGDKVSKERISRVSKVLYYIDEEIWDFIPSWDVKATWDVEIDRGARFYGMLSSKINHQTKYLIYNIGKTPTPSLLKRIQMEQRVLREKGIYKVIVLAETKEAMEAYPLKFNQLEEQLLLPYTTQGIDIINILGKVDINAVTCRFIYGNTLRQTDWQTADYEIFSSTPNKRYVVNLITNDIEKRKKLINHLALSSYSKNEDININIVCLDWQYTKFSQEYKNCSIDCISHNQLLDLVQKEV